MYIKRKGTETVIEAKLAAGPQRDPDVAYNPKFINPDSLFVFNEPGNGVTMLNPNSDNIQDFDICTKDGRVVCSLDTMADTLLRTWSTIEEINATFDKEIQGLDDFIQSNKGRDIYASPNMRVGSISISNPTLERVATIAAEYDLFAFNDARSGFSEPAAFGERVERLLESMENTQRALNEMRTVQYDDLKFTFIHGENLLNQRQIKETNDIDFQNSIIVDKGQGIIDINAPGEILERIADVVGGEVYYDDFGRASATFDIGGPWANRETLNREATNILGLFADAAKEYAHTVHDMDKAGQSDLDDQEGLDSPGNL